jgi:hypothetical protein
MPVKRKSGNGKNKMAPGCTGNKIKSSASPACTLLSPPNKNVIMKHDKKSGMEWAWIGRVCREMRNGQCGHTSPATVSFLALNLVPL